MPPESMPPENEMMESDGHAIHDREETPWYIEVDPRRRYATLTFLRGALVSLAITVVAGSLAVLFYIPAVAEVLKNSGLGFPILRPIHTTFASAWIFLGGIAIVHRHMLECGGETSQAERWRLRLQVVLWAVAGGGILISLALGITSGREYMGFHPIFSVALLAGWLCFAWNFFLVFGRGFWSRPVYVSMWGVGVLFFIFTFLEQHLYLLPGIFADPIVDLRIQWKATGTLVGSFNLFVYGTLYYVAEKVSGDKHYAYSKLAYALFWVGLLNSFTNFAHHTYHLPQGAIIKWISFLVSMTEALILIRVIADIAKSVSPRGSERFHATKFFLVSAKWWTAAMLASAILLSIPPLNAFVHGTHVITGHAMGTEIGIDSMVLFAAVCWLLGEMIVRRGGNVSVLHSSLVRWSGIGLNVAAALLVTWLHISGSIVGWWRYQLLPPPDWFLRFNYNLFAALGLATALFLASLLGVWLRVAFMRSTDESAPPPP